MLRPHWNHIFEDQRADHGMMTDGILSFGTEIHVWGPRNVHRVAQKVSGTFPNQIEKSMIFDDDDDIKDFDGF